MEKDSAGKFSARDVAVLKKLLLTSVVMFAFPLSTFFLLQKILPKGNVILPVVGSVLAVHIVIGIYIWMAITEGAEPDVKGELAKKD